MEVMRIDMSGSKDAAETIVFQLVGRGIRESVASSN